MLHIACRDVEESADPNNSGIVLNAPTPPACLRTTQRFWVVVVGGLFPLLAVVTVNGSWTAAKTSPAASMVKPPKVPYVVATATLSIIAKSVAPTGRSSTMNEPPVLPLVS